MDDTPPFKNEVDSLVIEFASLFTSDELSEWYDFREYRLFVAIEDGKDGAPAGPVAVSELEWAYSCFRALAGRAIAAEEGLLFHRGKRLRAEDYFTVWEKASKAPISLPAALAQGIQPVVRLYRPEQQFGGSTPEGQAEAQAALASPYKTHTGPLHCWEIPLQGKADLQAMERIAQVPYSYGFEGPRRECFARRVTSFLDAMTAASAVGALEVLV